MIFGLAVGAGIIAHRFDLKPRSWHHVETALSAAAAHQTSPKKRTRQRGTEGAADVGPALGPVEAPEGESAPIR